jgi:hypothetical protein
MIAGDVLHGDQDDDKENVEKGADRSIIYRARMSTI